MGIFKLLQDRNAFKGSYSSLKAFIHKKEYKKIRLLHISIF